MARVLMSHWSVEPESRSQSHNHRLTSDKRVAARQQARDEFAKLKGMGFKTPYFQYPHKDEKAKAAARRQAESFVAIWESKSGVKLSIHEGCFL